MATSRVPTLFTKPWRYHRRLLPFRPVLQFCPLMTSASAAQRVDSSTDPSVDLHGVKAALAKAFLHLYFKSVRWASVFSSVARGTAHERSDVDLLVIVSPRNRSDPPPPPDTQLLEDALPQALGKPVDVVYIEEGQAALRGYIQLEALLTSKTVYIRDHGVRPEVVRLRKLCEDCLQQGHSRFTTVFDQIQRVRDEFYGVSKEAFLGLPEPQKTAALAQLESLLELLDIQPPSDPMHEGFWFIVVEDAEKIRTRLTKLYPRNLTREQQVGSVLDSAVAGAVWEIIDSSGEGGLEKLQKRIKKFVLPALTETQELVGRAEDIFTIH
ncbi:uncharacterized protein B0H64DRAFT_93330 [Chaetomium fimeti]|uniref:Polymerase beta nucleotidyltransferase domain-containing protein n=1 Tax=Chaetomium fimeti TaxID=1854472 RepID=A0AAE0HMC6_9PEZI|nr:hypothetical protein B0H64DRAFT_93330 [Chaetomium fimeti]